MNDYDKVRVSLVVNYSELQRIKEALKTDSRFWNRALDASMEEKGYNTKVAAAANVTLGLLLKVEEAQKVWGSEARA